MNKIFLLGSLTKEPELKTTQDGKSYARSSLAVWRPSSKDKNACDYFNLVAWDARAETLSKYCKRGSKIAVIGRVQTGKYQNKDGVEVPSFDVVVEEISFAGKSNGEKQP